jgi:hypothetical protein
VAFIVPNGARICDGVHSGVDAGTVGVVSMDRPAKARAVTRSNPSRLQRDS